MQIPASVEGRALAKAKNAMLLRPLGSLVATATLDDLVPCISDADGRRMLPKMCARCRHVRIRCKMQCKDMCELVLSDSDTTVETTTTKMCYTSFCSISLHIPVYTSGDIHTIVTCVSISYSNNAYVRQVVNQYLEEVGLNICIPEPVPSPRVHSPAIALRTSNTL